MPGNRNNQYTYMAGLTPRQKQVYDIIRYNIMAHGKCPSYDELALEIGVVKSGICRVVDALIEKGYLTKIRGRARSLVLCKVCCPHCGGDISEAKGEEHDIAGNTTERIRAVN